MFQCPQHKLRNFVPLTNHSRHVVFITSSIRYLDARMEAGLRNFSLLPLFSH